MPFGPLQAARNVAALAVSGRYSASSGLPCNFLGVHPPLFWMPESFRTAQAIWMYRTASLPPHMAGRRPPALRSYAAANIHLTRPVAVRSERLASHLPYSIPIHRFHQQFLSTFSPPGVSCTLRRLLYVAELPRCVCTESCTFCLSAGHPAARWLKLSLPPCRPDPSGTNCTSKQQATKPFAGPAISPIKCTFAETATLLSADLYLAVSVKRDAPG